MTIIEASVASADGTRIAFRRLGNGPPVVILHAGLGSSRSWRAVAEHLAGRHECFVVDRRGHGASADTDGTHAFEDEVADARAVLGAAGRGAVLIGHCYGAAIALEVARTSAPGEVGRLVLYDPGGPELRKQFAPDGIEHLSALVASGAHDDALEHALAYMVASDALAADEAQAALAARPSAQWDALVAEVPTLARELTAVRTGADWSAERLRGASMPTLLLIVETSPPPHRREVRALLETLPDARMQPLAGQGHVAHVTAPDQLAEAIASFLGER